MTLKYNGFKISCFLGGFDPVVRNMRMAVLWSRKIIRLNDIHHYSSIWIWMSVLGFRLPINIGDVLKISQTQYIFIYPNRKYCNYYLEKSVKMIFNGIVCVGILFTHSKLLLSLQDFFHNILRENQKWKIFRHFSEMIIPQEQYLWLSTNNSLEWYLWKYFGPGPKPSTLNLDPYLAIF